MSQALPKDVDYRLEKPVDNLAENLWVFDATDWAFLKQGSYL